MMKSISLLLSLIFLSLGIAIAGTTPGQETGFRKNFRKTPGSNLSIESALPVASEVAVPSQNAELNTPGLTGNSSEMNLLKSKGASRSASKEQQIRKKGNGLSLGHFSLRNVWQAGKALKNQHKSQFIQISITIFLFIVILLLIGMLIGVIFDNLFIIFYIALALMLIWIILYMLGNLGIKKR